MLPLQQRLSETAGRMPAWVRIVAAAGAAVLMYFCLTYRRYPGHAWVLAAIAGFCGFGFIEVLQLILKRPLLVLLAGGLVWALIRYTG
jgi:hypothetical protein